MTCMRAQRRPRACLRTPTSEQAQEGVRACHVRAPVLGEHVDVRVDHDGVDGVVLACPQKGGGGVRTRTRTQDEDAGRGRRMQEWLKGATAWSGGESARTWYRRGVGELTATREVEAVVVLRSEAEDDDGAAGVARRGSVVA